MSFPRPIYAEGPCGTGGHSTGAQGAAKRPRLKASGGYRPLIIRPFTKGGEVWCPARARPAGRGGGKNARLVNLIPPTGAVRFKHSRWPLCSSSCSATLHLFRCKATASPQPSHQHASPPSSRDPTSLTTHGLILMYKLLYVHCHSCDSTQPKLYTSWAATRRPWLS